jgi:amidase
LALLPNGATADRAIIEVPAIIPAHVFTETLSLGGDGPRVGVKDSIDIEGHVTRMASACLAQAVPAARNATVVTALLDAGCHIVGKTNMHELAYGLTGINAWAGTPRNPRAPDRVPGGSSSGSAVAVAAGLVDFALGNDTGGSIRIPAACCGIYGLKPTFGRVSRDGVLPTVSTLDCVGPLAPSLAALEQAMGIIDPTFIPAAMPSRARLGWVGVRADAQILAACRKRIERPQFEIQGVELLAFAAAFDAQLAVIGVETWRAFGDLTEKGCLGEDVRRRLLQARAVGAAEVASAELVRLRFRAEVDALLATHAALVLPTLPQLPLPLNAVDAAAALRSSALVRQFNLSGHPALSLPLAVAGVPLGLQLVGRRGEDAQLCALARLLESTASA